MRFSNMSNLVYTRFFLLSGWMHSNSNAGSHCLTCVRIASDPYTLGFSDANKLCAFARSRTLRKIFIDEPCGVEGTCGAVLHVHQLVVSPQTTVYRVAKRHSNDRKICPIDRDGFPPTSFWHKRVHLWGGVGDVRNFNERTSLRIFGTTSRTAGCRER